MRDAIAGFRSSVAATGMFAAAFAAPGQCPPRPVADLIPTDGSASASFGHAVDLRGDLAIVGANSDDDMGVGSGSAYLYRWDGAAWSLEAKLLPPDGNATDHFGHAVAVDGNVAVVGAYRKESGDRIAVGAVYVFRHDGSAWNFEARLEHGDSEPADLLGWSVDVDGDVIVAGARGRDDLGTDSGAACIFRFDGAGWTQEAQLVADDGQQLDQFGWAVGIDGDRVVIGSRLDNAGALDAGSAYVFRRSGGAWSQEAHLRSPAPATDAVMGYSVSIDGTRVLVGAPGADVAYLFEFDGGAWNLSERWTSGEGSVDTAFGASVSLSGDRALVGEPYANATGFASGAARLFGFDGAEWGSGVRIVGPLADDRAHFGFAVALDATTALVGAPDADPSGLSSGAAFAFDAAPAECPSLIVDAACPDGGVGTIAWSGATPGGSVAVVYAATEGAVVIPDGSPCAGTMLALGGEGIRLVFQGVSDDTGSGSSQARHPAGVCGSLVQLIDLATCRTSPIVTIE